MKWIAGVLIALEMGVLSHYDASEYKKTDLKSSQIKELKQPFVSVDIVKAKLQFEGRRAMMPVALFSIDTEMLSSMKRGERLMLKNMDQHSYQLEVKEKHYFKNSIAIQFQCQTNESPCSAAVTIGSTHTYMLLHTSQGTYEMEARNDVAYFYKK
jgi:hypothetical protein